MPNEYFPDDDDDDDQESGAGDQNQSSPINTLRKQLREARKAQKALETEAAELRTFREQVTQRERESAVIDTARQLGLSEKAAKLFMKVNPETEPTRESIAAFAVEYELATPSAEAQALASSDGVPFTPAFIPVQLGGSAPVQNKITREQWLELQKTDFQAAADAFSQGRVEGLSTQQNR